MKKVFTVTLYDEGKRALMGTEEASSYESYEEAMERGLELLKTHPESKFFGINLYYTK